MKTKLPGVLFHGSAFLTAELKPGFMHTGVEVQWDKTESNHFLYATTVRDSAIELGFASSLEKKFLLDEFHTDGTHLRIVSPQKNLTVEMLGKLPLYLYTITPKEEHGWVHNHNQNNNMPTEWKTDRVIPGSLTVEQIDVARWLKSRRVTIEHSKPPQKPPAYTNW